MTVLKILYVIALAITLVVMVGYGIHAFYEGSGGDYHRNVLIIAYVWGLLFIVVSLALKPKLGVIKTGFLVGALITIVYAACQGAGRVSDAVMFGYTAVSLFVLFSVGYIKLIDRKKPATPTLIDEFLPFINIAYIITTTIFLILLVTFGISAFYQGHGGDYHRNVLIIAYASGLFYLFFSLALKPSLGIIKLSLGAGALITILYAAGQGAGHLSDTTAFGYTAVSLIVLFFVGYIKLIIRKRPETPTMIDHMKPAIEIIYVLAMAILLVLLVGYGIHAFYQGHGGDYHRNVLIIAYASGLFYLFLSLVLKPSFSIIKISLGAGALITIVYAAGQGAGHLSNTAVFGYIAFSLLVLFFAGYIKLINRRKPATPTMIDHFIPTIEVFYVMAMSILLVLLVGYGIHAFYQGHGGDYHRNVLIIAYASGLFYLLLSLPLKPTLGIIKASLGIGALITILYAAGQGAGHLSDTAVFGYIAVSLLVLFFVGYVKLIPWKQPETFTRTAEWMPAIKIFYTFAMAILLVLLVAYGIWAFYKDTGSTDYHRNALFIAYISALFYIILGLVLKPRFNIMRIGLFGGGLITMVFAVGKGFSNVSDPLRFTAIALVLILLLILGYVKLVPRIKPSKPKPKAKEEDGQS